jgi:acyl transferase domain-containing protein/surfactin synthase thioesterase subunit/acyl carrier protein
MPGCSDAASRYLADQKETVVTSAAGPASVAIVGIACRFPGASDQRAYWRNLCSGIESITVLTDNELSAAGVPTERLGDPAYVKAAPILPGIDQFDAAFFEYSPTEARLMDPQHRLLLEVVWEAFEDAGYRPGGPPRPAGVFVGAGGVVSSYLVDRLAFSADLPGHTGSVAHIGNDKDFLSTRVSYKLNLTGPSVNVQTACSTSLVAVHLACQAILAGECDMALAGAATVRVPQRVGYLSRQGDILSPDGHCRAFDAAAQGTIFGSGVGAVLLKDLHSAIADHDNIYAVIRGSAINNDGADKVSYTSSSVAGQAKAMVEAISIANISPDDISYVECHGTGTVIGDPLEIDALSRAFRTGTDRRGFCAIGSVKTNIGHLEQTAGMAALIKAALAVKEGKIPASLNFRTPNRKIDFASSPFFVNTECRDWPADRPRVAAVNSLGLGGTNAFLVLDEAPQASATPVTDQPLNLVTVSGRSARALRASIERHRTEIERRSDAELPDICFTLSSGRNHFDHRFAAVVGSIAQLRSVLTEELEKRAADDRALSERKRIAFLFSGQGSQHVDMGAELYRHQPVYRAVIDRCAALLRDRLDLSLLDVLFGKAGAGDAIHQTAYTQPALFAVQAALIELWRSWGVFPDMVLGHSVGEFAAAHCAGVYSLETALLLITERARLMQALPAGGAMASIFADESTVAAIIDKRKAKKLAVAAVNARGNVVVSGEVDEVSGVVKHFEGLGVRTQPLTVSHAFHSPLMQPIMQQLGSIAATTSANSTQIPWISTLSGTAVSGTINEQYWCDHARRPVRFIEGMNTIAALGATDFIEIGPGSALLALGRQCVNADGHAWLGSLADKRHGDVERILLGLSELYRRGHDVDWDGFYRPLNRRRISLPTYPFEGRRFWLGDDAVRPQQRTAAASTNLAGSRLRSGLPDIQFETTYSLARFRYLNDHRIHGMPVLPLTFGLTALRDAARQHFGTDGAAIANLQYRQAMVLADAADRIVQIILTPTDDVTAEFRLMSIGSEPAAAWQTHMIGMIRANGTVESVERAELPIARIKSRCPTAISTERYYATLHEVGLQYGPSFRAIQELWHGDGEVLAHVDLPAHLIGENAPGLHPALLDACLHVYPALVDAHGNFEQAPTNAPTYLPISLERFHSVVSDARKVWVHATRRHRQPESETVAIDVAVYREDGSRLAMLEGLSVKQLPPEALAPVAMPERVDWLYQMQWVERPLLQPSATLDGEPSSWLILADRSGIGAALCEMLSGKGATCRLVYADKFIGRRNRAAWSPDDLVKPFATLISGFTDRSAPLRGIINLWALDLSVDYTSVEQLNEAQKIVLGSTISLLRAVVQARVRADTPPRIWPVTRNSVSITPEDPPVEVAAAALWGLGRSATLEHPQIWGGQVDLDASPAGSPSTDAAAVLREVLNRDGEDQVALRKGVRFAPRLVRATAPKNSTATFDSEGCYLITGGLGALGVEVARWLVTQRKVKRVILVGRRGQKDPSSGRVQHALAALGAEVTILKADVSNEKDVRRLLGRIEKFYPPLKGIFHCAGVLDDGILMQMEWQKFQRVVAPKLAGGWLLDKFTRHCNLDHFVAFSSILSLIGSAGQANYAAANAFLDALISRRRKEALPALALNWGPWAESGLATVSGEKGRAIWRSRGTEYISADIGRRALDLLVGSDAAHAAITITKWPTFLQQFTSPPPLYRELHKEVGAATANAGLSASAALVKSKMKEVSPAARRDLLIAFVRQQAMQTLGMKEEIDAGRPLREFGLDSLMSVTLVNRLETALGIRISAVKLIQGPSVAEIVDDIFPDLGYAKDDNQVEKRARRSRKSASSRWLVVADARPSPRLRLFCFPFAGGGSAVYHSWSQFLDSAIEVVAVEPPGRLGRIEEKPIVDIKKFSSELVSEMRPLLDLPFAFFGHCLGGLTMYETARRLIRSTKFRPIHLFVSGARPPDRVVDQGPFEDRLIRDLIQLTEFRRNLPMYVQPDDVFGELIRHFNIPATDQLLRDPKLRKLMLPVVRAEFRMASNYKFVKERPWDIPITCFAARGDPYVSRHHALGWGRFTNSRLQVYIRDGAHFAVVDDMAFIHGIMNKELRPQSQH